MDTEQRIATRWAVRVQVTGSTGVKGEPFLWSDLGRIGGPLMSATLLESREEARGRARWARDRLMTALDARRVVATPVRVRVTTTVEVLEGQKGDPVRLATNRVQLPSGRKATHARSAGQP